MKQKYLFSIALLLFASLCRADGGVLEISQTCINSGCFAGDSDGFPVELSQPGSYVLTSNIEVNQNTTAIRITADDVTLDLNGFAIRGQTTCSTTSPPTCSNTGIGIGIESEGDNTAIFNGTVSGMGDDCINLDWGHVSDVRIVECGSDGLYITLGLVENVAVYTVPGTGIGIYPTGSAAYVRDSLVRSVGRGVIAQECDNVVVQHEDLSGSCTDID